MSQILVIDTGGQYCHLIDRRVRGMGVNSEICSPDDSVKYLKNIRGIIISGGPKSVDEHDSIKCPPEVFNCNIPVLGICYGHQLMARVLGGVVKSGKKREYGEVILEIVKQDTILRGLTHNEVVWMSHGDNVVTPPPNFDILAKTKYCKIATMVNKERNMFGLQFHPEVTHTPKGQTILNNFVFTVCKCKEDWNVSSQIPDLLDEIRHKVNSRNVLFFVSGGVDSTVGFALCTEALGPDRVLGIFVDTGFMRKGEREQIEEAMQQRNWNNVRFIDAKKMFLTSLEGISDPEEKRHIIGDCFLNIQQEVSSNLNLSPEKWMLGQGTIYPDTIESGDTINSAKIKTHHNRVSAIQTLIQKGLIIEPLVSFYKDEVRKIGEEIGLPHDMIAKHPFPGPGLAVRCLCSDAEYYANDLSCAKNKAPNIFGLKALSVPIRTVGVQGDYRSFSKLVILMGEANLETYGKASRIITNEIPATNRVAFLVNSRDEFLSSPKVHRAFLTLERVNLLREADYIVNKLMKDNNFIDKIWQCPIILLPLSFDKGETIAIRPVCSLDAMTAKYADLPMEFIKMIGKSLLEISGVDAVIYDVTDKPPATIEWE